jgi:hypothetical protein
MSMNPKYPIYIVSKGRWESRLTAKALEAMQVPYQIVVEEHEFDKYASVIDSEKILVLPEIYLREYDTCDDLGSTKSKGPGAARNFAWDHSIKFHNAKWHWVMDDNIGINLTLQGVVGFFRLNHNLKVPVSDGTILRASEVFVERYENVAQAGLNYFMFASRKSKVPPYYLNTRIYSCLLIRNDIPYRWRGRYNEDTDLSLRALKDGWCTVLYNAFLCYKQPTQALSGGNTEEFYAKEGTAPKSKMLCEMHPDCCRMVVKFQRAHHHVNYAQFRYNKLRLKPVVEIKDGVDNMGMVLQNLDLL